MFPGFITAYRDENNYVNLYFFFFLDNDMLPIFNEIELSNDKYLIDEYKYDDNAIKYKFNNKRITKINCKLVYHKTNKYIIKTLKV